MLVVFTSVLFSRGRGPSRVDRDPFFFFANQMAKISKDKKSSKTTASAQFIDQKTSQKILKIVALQQQELEEELEQHSAAPQVDLIDRQASEDSEPEDEEIEQVDEQDYTNLVNLDEDELAVLNKFMSIDASANVMQKMASSMPAPSPEAPALNEKVVLVYKKQVTPLTYQSWIAAFSIQERKATENIQNNPITSKLV